MSEQVVVAYVPVVHEGYVRLLERHATGRRVFVAGPELYADYRPLAKDVRALAPDDAARAIAGLDIASSVTVLDTAGAQQLAQASPTIVLPAEDVSYRIVEQHFERCAVLYDPVFLRWDKTKTVQLLATDDIPELPAAEVLADLLDGTEGLDEVIAAASGAARQSVDWWRRVGAAMRLPDGRVIAAHNEHLPHELSAYAVGDPRSNFYKGVHLELTTAIHAEAQLIAAAAADGHATRGAVAYVTDFPCPPCSKLLAAAGISRLYFREGYAVLDGRDVLEAAGVELVRLAL
jgi:dCMP deaminase